MENGDEGGNGTEIQHAEATHALQVGENEDSYLEALKDKKKKLEKLSVDVQKLERTPAKATPSNISLKSSPQKSAEDEVYKRLITLEKELKARDLQVERLLYEKKALSEIVRQQEAGLLDMSHNLHDSKQQILKLSREARLKNDESKMLFTDTKTNFEHSLDNMKLIKALDTEHRAKGRDNVSAELYYQVMRLENEAKDKTRVIGELSDENKTMEKMLRETEDAFLKAHNDLKERSEDEFAYEQQLIFLKNRIVELEHSLSELQGENATLLTIQKAKTGAIEHLTHQLNARTATQEYVEQLRRQVNSKEQEIQDTYLQAQHLIQITKEREAEIHRLKKEEVGIPFHIWHEERRLLQAEVKNLQEAKITSDKKIREQKEKLLQMNDRIAFIAKHLGTKVPQSPTAKKKSGFYSPLMSPTGKDEPKLPNFEDEEAIPIQIYDALEKSLKKLTATLSAKENALGEKDEVLEMLEKKLDVATKSHAADSRLWKKKEQEFKDQVEALTEKMHFMEEDYREKEQELRMEIHRLKQALKPKS